MTSKKFILILTSFFLIHLFTNNSFSIDPDEILENKKLE